MNANLDLSLKSPNLKGLLFCIACCIGLLPAKAQSAVTFDGSSVFSTFKFKDSNGNTDRDYSPNIGSAYNLGYLYSAPNGLLIGMNIGLREAGASKDVSGTTILWNFQYAEAKLGLGYMLNTWKLKPYVMISPYYASLLKASQAFNEQVFDIKNDKDVINYDYGLMATGGVNMRVSDLVAFYISYNQIYGIKNIEVASGEELYNRGFSISLGISFIITKATLQ
jgi:hypothetical protein